MAITGAGRTTETAPGTVPRSSALGACVAVLVAVLAATAAGMFVATHRYGIGLISDSVAYLQGAHSLATGHGYTHDGGAITAWPPGYSAVLCVGEWLGVKAIDGARVLAVLAFLATTVLGFLLLRRHVRSPAVVMAGTAVIGCSAVLLQVFDFAYSEHLFVVDLLLLLLVLESLVARPRSVPLLSAAVVLVWAGFYFRYAGIVLVPFAAFVVLVTRWPRGRVRALLASGAFAVAAVAVPVLWMIRNVDAGSGPMGGREAAAATASTNVGLTLKTVSGWFVLQGPDRVRLAAMLAVLAAVTLLAVAVLRARRPITRQVGEIWPLALFVAVYVFYLTASASIVAFASIDTRFLIPVYVPLVVIGAWAFERLLGRLHGSGRRVLAVVALTWVGVNVVWFGGHALNAERHGLAGYQTARWHHSMLVADVRRLSPYTTIYTNDYPGIELFTGRVAHISVEKTYFASSQTTSPAHLANFVKSVAAKGDAKLVWFLPNFRPRLYSPEELSHYLCVVESDRRADGVIYDLLPLPTAATAGPAGSCSTEAAKVDVPPLPDCSPASVASCTVVHGTGPRVLLLGDSNARMYIPTFVKIAEREHLTLSVAASPSCPWQEGLYYPIAVDDCKAKQAEWYGGLVDELAPDVIVLADRPLDDPVNPAVVVTSGGILEPGAEGFEAAAQDLSARSIAALRKGARKLVIVEPIPIAPVEADPLSCLSRATAAGQCVYEADSARTPLEEFYASAVEPGAVWSIDLDRLVCPRLPTCDAVVNGVIVKRDSGHLTATFASSIGDAVDALLRQDGVIP